MKTKTTLKAAFTLVEMLVVIVIIALVATATSSAIWGAQRTARAAKCQANLKNLHTAVVAYLADRRELWGLEKDFERLTSSDYHSGFVYPRASSYEYKDKHWDESEGRGVDKFWECHGWVSWIKPSGDRLDDSGKTPWIADNHRKSHAEKCYYPANSDQNMQKAIAAGYLFKYVGKDLSTYRCPEHKRGVNGETIYLAYAMNNWFGSHVHPNRDARSTSSFSGKIQPSRMALFVEMEGASNTDPKERKGVTAEKRNVNTLTPFAGDCAWDWDGEDPEPVRFSHRKGSSKYCNVVFVDGHVAAIPENAEDISAEWNGHKTLEEAFQKMGEGLY